MTSTHTRYDVRITQKECMSLVKAGYEVYLIVCDDAEEEEYKGIHIISTGFKPKSRLERFYYAGKLLYRKAIAVDAEIYCFHDPELIRFAKGLYNRGKKVIFDSHEFYALQILTREYIPFYFRKGIAWLYQKIEKYYLQYINAVLIPCTIDNKNYFADKARKTVYISNVPKLCELYDWYDENAEKENALCHVGSLTYERGIWHLAKAMENINAKLKLAGFFSPLNFQEELKKVKGYEKVEYLGFCNREDVKKLYMKSKIGLCTILNVGQYNHIDTMATKIYEYMSMGIPVVLSDTPYIKKVLSKYPFGIAVSPENPQEIADAVNFLLDHPEVADQMGKTGRKAIKETYNWEIEEEKLLHLYRELER